MERATKTSGAPAILRSKPRSWTILILAFVGLALGLNVGRELGADFGFGTSGRVEAQTATPGADVEALRESIGNFFETLSDPNQSARKALEDFSKNTAFGSNEKTLASLADSLKNINANFGPYVAYEPIGVKSFGSDLTTFRYLYKCRDYPVVWYFTYYRPRAKASEDASTNWTLIGMRFDSDVEKALLEDSSF